MTSIWSIFIQISIRMSVSNHPPTKRLASQPANQPTNQSNIEPINNSTNHTTNQPFNQTTNQPFNRTNPTITQSANQQINPATLTLTCLPVLVLRTKHNPQTDDRRSA
jgi:hypothetical protein